MPKNKVRRDLLTDAQVANIRAMNSSPVSNREMVEFINDLLASRDVDRQCLQDHE